MHDKLRGSYETSIIPLLFSLGHSCSKKLKVELCLNVAIITGCLLFYIPSMLIFKTRFVNHSESDEEGDILVGYRVIG